MTIRARTKKPCPPATNGRVNSRNYCDDKESESTKKVIGAGVDQFSFIELLGFTLILVPAFTLLFVNGYLYGPRLLEPMLGNFFPNYYFISVIIMCCGTGSFLGVLFYNRTLPYTGKALGLSALSLAASPLYVEYITSFSMFLGPYATTHLSYLLPVYIPAILCSWVNVALLGLNMSFFKHVDTPLHAIVLLTTQLALIVGGFSSFIGGFLSLSRYSCYGALYTSLGGMVGLCILNFTLLRRLRATIMDKLFVPATVLFIIVFVFNRYPRCGLNPIDRSLEPAYTTLARKESITGWVSVCQEAKRRVRVMRSGHSILGGTFIDYDESVFGSFYYMEAVQYIKRVDNPDQLIESTTSPTRALQIGLGIGVSAKSLTKVGVAVDVVEIDPVVYDYARHYFKLPKPANVFIQDGHAFLRSVANASSYDYILHDVFTGGTVPSSLFSVEALQLCKRALKPNGILALNYVGGVLPPYNSSFATVTSTLQSVFSHVRVFTEEFHSDQDLASLINLVFFAADFPISFNPFPSFQDPQSIQAQSLNSLVQYEIKLDQYLPSPTPPPITEHYNPLLQLQHVSAYTHWYKMKELFPLEFWQHY